MAERKKSYSKTVHILGHKVAERDLNRAMRGVLKARGLSGDLILEKPMTAKDKARLRNEDFQYANVYKYAFF